MSGERATPIHPDYAAFFEKTRNHLRPSSGLITPQEYRENLDKAASLISLPKVIEKEMTITYNNIEVKIILFRPPESKDDELLPILIYYHGGGFVFGSRHSHSKAVRQICVENDISVMFVDYSLAPEHKYPTAHEECYAAFAWVLERGKDIHVDTSKIAVCGDSAGGSLAAAIPIMAKERGIQKDVIKAQILIYPWLSPSAEAFQSYHEFGNGNYPLSLKDMVYYDKVYFTQENKDKFSHPLLATVDELQYLPPALVLTAEADVLRDEGEAYARKLTEAGVPTASVRLIGAVHTYFSSALDTPVYKQTLNMIKYQLSEAFKK
ncbi:alpha/beta hydrolase fold-domain-containing protein [Phascolomyces articulosus]|uniref:Alpha/beta hydrolase fold-domain-containing protein n=1 Tax=Phascolomyces articulosus TaxID=60185 RepID=A0AAD5P977_9FUNG|nr:alpha/beta hydrolase fold-domain-containing protein [Phascolomyces articulosus]